VALQRDKDVGQGTGEQFRVKEVVRFLKARYCAGVMASALALRFIGWLSLL
jgi:hypothetical protein